jgi:hypothetical protein
LTLAASGRRKSTFIDTATIAFALAALAAASANRAALGSSRPVASPITERTRFVAIGACAEHAAVLLTTRFVETGIGWAVGTLSYSTTTSGLPKKGVNPHGLAMGIATNFLSAHHSRDFDMPFDFRRTLRTSAYLFGLSSVLAACGGGNGGGDEATGTASTAAAITGGDTAAGRPSGTGTVSVASAVSPVKPVDDAEALAAAPESADLATTQSTTLDSDTMTASLSTVAATSHLAVTPVEPGTSATPTAVIASSTTMAASPMISAASRSGIGMNLGMLNTTSPEIPSIDLMKRGGAWYVGCAGAANTTCSNFTGLARPFDTLEEDKLDLDAQGWIKSLPASSDTSVKFRFATTTLSSGTVPDGKYVVRYDGAGTISYSGIAKKVAAESTPGRDIVQLTNSASGGFFLTINATTPSNYLRNIRVYPPGGACANDYATFAASASACTATTGAFVPFESFPADRPWYPPFITDAKGFRTLRFMDWMHANSTTIADWASRSLPTDRMWTGDNGVPIEAMVDISNAAGADPWMNLPAHATDDYVHQFGRLVYQRLATNLHLNLEYSNETWNSSFAQTKWMKDQGVAKWPAELAKGANPYYLGYNWYAQRLVQVCNIVKQEFGADASRVRCIANTQAANASQTSQVLACTYAAAALGKPCGKLIDAVAIAPYFGFYIGSAANRPTVQTWYTDADGGLGKLFTEINGVDSSGKALTAPLMTAFPAGARGMAKGWMTTTKAVADTYGLPMWAYEGGQHLVPPPGDTDAKFLALITAANRDPRMGTAYDQDIADWKAAGGQAFAYYSHVARPSKFGIWGVKESLVDVNNPKWKSVTKSRDASACWWAGC